MTALNHYKFFSLQDDSNTDIGNTENESFFLFFYFDSHSADGKVHVRFFTVMQLGSGTAFGLME